MSLSKRARRGISIFSKIQWDSPKRGIYLMSQKRMTINLAPPADPKLVQAASEAMEILVKNGEEANANLQKLSDSEGHTVTPSEEGCAPGDISLQQGDNQKA